MNKFSLTYNSGSDAWYDLFDTDEELQKASVTMSYLENEGFEFLKWDSSETVTVTGAWLETPSMVFCLTDATPWVDDSFGKDPSVMVPEPINHPTEMNKPCMVSIWFKPFGVNQAGETWEMDGTPPSAFDERWVEDLTPTFQSVTEAVKFVFIMMNCTVRVDIPSTKVNPEDMKGLPELKKTVLVLGEPSVHEINGHMILVPTGLAIHYAEEDGYDRLKYRGYEISTFEEGDVNEDGFYTGQFGVFSPDGVYSQHDTLEAVKQSIDGKVAPKVPEEPAKAPPNEMTLTIAQATAVYKKWQMLEPDDPDVGDFGEFLKTVQPTFKCDDAVTVQWKGMWLCIEKDGYCHS